MKAYIGLLLYAGVHRSHGTDISDLWSKSRGPPIFRATMGRQRFHLITRFIRFDDKVSRQQRRQQDKLAAFRTIWNSFVKRCQESFIPGYEIAVDEQIIPYRGKASFKIYMKNKPHS